MPCCDQERRGVRRAAADRQTTSDLAVRAPRRTAAGSSISGMCTEPVDVAGVPLVGLAHVEDGQALGQRVGDAGRPRRWGSVDMAHATSAACDIRRSASGLPPVWQVGQYCRLESAKLTSRTMSPQTGHFSPVRPCTARLVFFSPLSSLAARPRERSTASPSSSLIAANSWSSSSAVEAVGRLERRHLRGVQDLVAVGVADAGDGALVAQHALDLRAAGVARGCRARMSRVNASSSGSGPRLAMPGTSLR